ncbi:MAG: cation transporter [Actinobacteria bacterium]|nr:cation transporter [Actinomycetota bacterium]MBU1943171.1 cation transporter [Actinomycetota bacterium]MBU2687849.1 cation transporter [Actinomycetota bacterium]
MPDRESSKKPLEGSARAAGIAAVVSFLFGATLVVWGVWLGSVVMTAGGIVAAARGVMGAFILAGILLSRRHSKSFPDGLYKVENIVATILGVIVLVLTYEVAHISIKNLGGVHVLTSDPKGALPFFIAAALLAGGVGYYKRRVAKAEGCPSLKADSYFSFADAAAMLIIGVALAIDAAGYHRVDAIAGLLVACLLGAIGVHIFLGGLKVLLDASVGRDILSKVREIAGADPDIRKVLEVDGRNSGSFIFLHVKVEAAAYDLSQAGGISRELERRIKSAIPNVDRVSVEFGAPSNAFTVAVPVSSDETSIASGFESSPMIGLFEVEGADVAFKPDVIDNPAVGVAPGTGVHLAVHLGRRPVDVLLLKEEITDDDVLQTLEAYAIDVSVEPTLSDLDSARTGLVGLAEARRAPADRPGDGEGVVER